MEATLTSKGQLTLPTALRDDLGLVAGSRLYFSLQPDRTIRARMVSTDPLAISDQLRPPSRSNVSEAEIKATIRRRRPARFERRKK